MTDTRKYSKRNESEPQEEVVPETPFTDTEIRRYLGALLNPKLDAPGIGDDYERSIDEASYIALHDTTDKPEDISRML